MTTQSQHEQHPSPPTLTHPRFTLELEFVSSLANPYYLSHLAVTYPNLFEISRPDENGGEPSPIVPTPSSSSIDAQAFTAYLAYLYSYWKTPEYSQFLTHPGATLRALRLLQEENFRRDIIRPQLIEALAGFGIEDGNKDHDDDTRQEVKEGSAAKDER